MKKWLLGGIIAAALVSAGLFPNRMLSPGPLMNAHREADKQCFSCHAPFQGIPQANCVSCHPIEEIGKDKPRAGGVPKTRFHSLLTEKNCIACHSDHQGRVPNRKAYFAHNLLAADIQNSCAKCHNAPEDPLHHNISLECRKCHNTETWKFKGGFDHSVLPPSIQNNCESCHKKPNDELHQSPADNCTACHSLKQWKPATFDHNKYFSLDGDHNARCNVCHTGGQYRSYTCYGCHEHTPENIRNEHLEEGIQNYTQCVRCHKSGNDEEHGSEHRGRRRGGEDD